MTKKLIFVWLSLTILLFSSISIYAENVEENVKGNFFIRDVVINGETIINNQLQYPFFIYKDTTYFPLTPEMGKILGVKAEMNLESRTLKLLKTEPTLTNISEKWQKNQREDVSALVLGDAKVLVYEVEPMTLEGTALDNSTAMETDTSQAAVNSVSGELIGPPQLLVKEIGLGDLPVLKKGNVLYLPIKAMTGNNGFDWDMYYDSNTGIYLSTNEGIPAKSYWKEAESKYNKGLATYIQNCNGSYTTREAQELVILFKEAADTYNIDERILMAVAQKESTFNEKAKARSGPLGMMQVMPSTGARYGLSKEQLLDAKTSINFGAMYLSERIAAYDGNLSKGFSAYNQGSVAVSRGTYSTRYATKIISTLNGINSYLTSNGYGLGY